jgi:hypothetical protein
MIGIKDQDHDLTVLTGEINIEKKKQLRDLK